MSKIKKKKGGVTSTECVPLWWEHCAFRQRVQAEAEISNVMLSSACPAEDGKIFMDYFTAHQSTDAVRFPLGLYENNHFQGTAFTYDYSSVYHHK